MANPQGDVHNLPLADCTKLRKFQKYCSTLYVSPFPFLENISASQTSRSSFLDPTYIRTMRTLLRKKMGERSLVFKGIYMRGPPNAFPMQQSRSRRTLGRRRKIGFAVLQPRTFPSLYCFEYASSPLGGLRNRIKFCCVKKFFFSRNPFC